MKKRSFKVYTFVTASKKMSAIWWNRVRRNAWRTIKRKWFKVPEGTRMPFYVRIFRVILFPVCTITSTIFDNLQPYDWATDSWTIGSLKFDDNIFSDLITRFKHRPDSCVQLILKKTTDNEIICVDRIVYYNKSLE